MENLIREEWFHGLHWGLLLLFTLVSMAVLIKGADWLVEGASGLAYRLGMPKVIVGATIVSLGTTSPECAVSVMAAWKGNAGLALGNAVGSIIADTALIFGLGALLCRLPADKFVLNRQGWVQLGSAVLLAGLGYVLYFRAGPGVDDDGNTLAQLGRWVGLMLLGLLVVYMWISVRWAKQHRHGEPFQTPEAMEQESGFGHKADETVIRHHAGLLLGMVLMGLVLVIFSSHVLIVSVSETARQLSIPQDVIAATLVAFGTSLPELVVGMMSIRKGHPELLVGNIIGADILNVLFVIGAAAAAAPLPIPPLFITMHFPVMLGVLLLFRLFIFRAVSKGHFARWNGVPLLAIYAGYVVLSYWIG